MTYARTHLKPSGGDPLVLVTNQDVILEPEFLGNLVREIDRRPSAGSAGGRILRAKEDHSEAGFRKVIRTDVIDTVGLRVFPSGRMADRGSGRRDDGELYRNPEDIFGVSGCVALYRLKALADAAYEDGTVFDEDFFMYKEDIDLAWRLRILGWGAAFAPDAVAYHFRTAVGGEKPSVMQVIRGRRNRPATVNRLSARNHLLVLFKNCQWGNIVRYWPLMLGYEAQKAAYSLFFEPRTFAAGLSAFSLWPRAMAKRRQVMRRAKARAKDIRRWFK
jgi:GT2 family glycosyltransferase